MHDPACSHSQVYRTRAKAVSSQPIFNAGTERFVRDWRSAIITVTVRDQRNREHDPIIGLVPLKLSDILETSSQVTRWYPLDGGIGFGRIRISLLFRSIETRLPPNMLGWDVGTFEFLSDTITATDYSHNAKIKLRTGGSVGKVGRHLCKRNHEGSGHVWDLSKVEDKKKVRLPVKYRYRSPIVFEFHASGKRGVDGYAMLWLQHLIDNESNEIDIPIWKTKAGARLTQNYITEENMTKDMPGLEDLEVIGRLKFHGRFKMGMDETHESFIVDNDSRETYETWEACVAEGVRQHLVEKELPERVQTLHDQSLTEGRDVLKQADADEKQKWLSKQGTDWSGAFGEDPKAYMDTKGRKRREPGVDEPLHDPHNPSSDEDHDDSSDSDDEDIGVMDADNAEMSQGKQAYFDGDGGEYGHNGANGNAALGNNRKSHDTSRTNYTTDTMATTDTNASLYSTTSKDTNKQNKRTEERKQRGIMQWKPARNAKFAKDEAKIGLRKLKNKMTGGLEGRQPGVETETGS